MSTEFYHFSGTGNSLAIARDVAGKTGGRLISIPSLMDRESLRVDADVMVVVFPVQHSAPPLIAERFVRKLTGLEDRYLVGICTYGDSPGLASEYLAKALESRGGNLAAGFAVHMPYNYITPSFALRGFLSSFVLQEISEFVNARRTGTFETGSRRSTRLSNWLGLEERLGKRVWLKVAGVVEPTELPFLESRQLMDHGFHCDEKCNGCGVCSRICPARDIEMVDAKLAWHHRCEQCFACLQWCPEEAIQFRNGTSGRKRYHHPGVRVSDMIRQSRQG